MELAVARKGRHNTNQLAAKRRLGRYASEVEQSSRQTDTKGNEVLEKLKGTWKDWDYEYKPKYEHLHESYETILSEIKDLRYSAKDVENFSLILAEFQYEDNFSYKAGFFLSALINNGNDEDYIIHTAHLSVDITCLGCENTKNILIVGNVGNMVGQSMKRGSIVVEGNANASVGGWMKGGSITVKGNAGVYVGSLMKGGSITVEGNAGIMVGVGMKGGSITVEGNSGNGIGTGMKAGEIHILGNCGQIDHFKGRKIYHKGELVLGESEPVSIWRRIADEVKKVIGWKESTN